MSDIINLDEYNNIIVTEAFRWLYRLGVIDYDESSVDKLASQYSDILRSSPHIKINKCSCGNIPTLYTSLRDDAEIVYRISCDNCGTTSGLYTSIDEAASDWNNSLQSS